MRILHLVHQYMPEHVGGTELYTETLARYQIKEGHSVAIFCPSSNPVATPWLPAADEEGVRVYRAPLGQRSRQQVFRDTFRQKRLHEGLTAVLAQENPDLIHIQHLMGLPYTLIDQIESAQIPFVITLHDYWYACANAQLITNYDNTVCQGPDKRFNNCGRCALARAGKSNWEWLAPTIAPLMAYRNGRLRHVLARAYRAIAPTHFVKQIYQEVGLASDNIIVIPHGIEVPHQKIKAILSQKRPRKPGTLHIGYVGSLGWQKGVHHLISAVNQLPHEGVRLSIYGGLTTFPDYVAQLRQSAQHPGIHFAGRISRDDLWEALAECDVVVLPTLWYEASPLTIQEVFAVGVPLVASRIGAMQEKIRDGVDGLLVPPGDDTALHDVLLQLLHDSDLLYHLQTGICPIYTMADQVKDIDDVYASGLTRPGWRIH